MPPPQKATLPKSFLSFIHGDDQNVGLHLFDNIGQVAFVPTFAHELEIRLVSNRCHH